MHQIRLSRYFKEKLKILWLTYSSFTIYIFTSSSSPATVFLNTCLHPWMINSWARRLWLRGEIFCKQEASGGRGGRGLSWEGPTVSFVIQSHVTQSCPTIAAPRTAATRLPCPSPSPRVSSNSGLLSQWYHPTISPSVVPFSSCPQSFPVSGSFPMSQLFSSGGQSIGASASASVLPMNIQGWFSLHRALLCYINISVCSCHFFSLSYLERIRLECHLISFKYFHFVHSFLWDIWS